MSRTATLSLTLRAVLFALCAVLGGIAWIPAAASTTPDDGLSSGSGSPDDDLSGQNAGLDELSSGGDDPSPWPWIGDSCEGEFDTPLSDLYRSRGPGRRIVDAASASSLESMQGDVLLSVRIDGTPIEAWLYWTGETRAVDRWLGEPDYAVTLERLVDGVVMDVREIEGTEAGRRRVLFPFETAHECLGNGGEVVTRGQIPLDLLVQGENLLRVPREDCLSCFDERSAECTDGPAPIYRQAFGVTLVVVLSGSAGDGESEVLVIDGADYATRDKISHRPECDPSQTRTELTCFRFDALACDARAVLRFAVAGLLPRNDDAKKPSTSEETLFASDSGEVDVRDLRRIELNQLIDANHFYRGENMSLYEGEVQLAAGDREACIRVDLFEKGNSSKLVQTALLAYASLEIPRSCTASSSNGEDPCGMGPGAAAACSILQISKGKLELKGEAGGVEGDVCVGAEGKFSIADDQYVEGTVRLAPGAEYKQSGDSSVGAVDEHADLADAIQDAEKLATDAESAPCTQIFEKLKSSTLVHGEAGLNVICTESVDLGGDEVLTLEGSRDARFILRVDGKRFKLKDGGRLVVDGGVLPEHVLVYLVGDGEEVEIKGGPGGPECCESILEGSILAPSRKIKLRPGLIRGFVISGEDIKLEHGGALRAHPLACLGE